MCGIAGFYSERSLADKESRIKAMTDIIEHRGPDDHGFHGDDHIAFGFRRLSIIDIDAGHQPLCNEDGTVWLIFNGEIYNYKALYNELIEKGHIFKSQSDSEVIVHAYEEWGTDFLHKIEGMFAIAIWDSITKKLLLTVDRTGIKPLYYSKIGSEIFFASEAKALFASGLVPCEADYSVLPYHMAFLTAPHPLTMFKDVKKLEPGHFLSIQNAEIEKHCYWDITFSEDKNRTLSDSEKTVQKLIDQAVESQSRADVPLGAFLSGGIDSSAVSYSLKQATGEAPETYFIKFRDEDLVHDVIMDESGYATQMAKDLGSKHHDITATSEGIDKLLPRLVWHMDEPVGDPAAITTYMVSKSARQSLTVLLSGVGGDEIFAGYPRHLAMLLMGKFLKLPKPLRIAIKSVGGLLPGGKNATFRNARKFLRSANNDPLSSYLGMLTYFSLSAVSAYGSK